MIIAGVNGFEQDLFLDTPPSSQNGFAGESARGRRRGELYCKIEEYHARMYG